MLFLAFVKLLRNVREQNSLSLFFVEIGEVVVGEESICQSSCFTWFGGFYLATFLLR